MMEFLNQGGFAYFVWMSYGVGFGLILAEIILLARGQRTILRRVGRLVRLNQPGGPSDRPDRGTEEHS